MIEWRSLPAKEEPRKTAYLIAFIVFLGVGLYYTWGVWWTLLGMFLLVVNILPYFLPTTYVMNDRGVYKKGFFVTQFRGWESIKSYYVDKYGVLLSPFDKPNRLENFRGMYVRFKGNKEQVIEFIRKKVGK